MTDTYVSANFNRPGVFFILQNFDNFSLFFFLSEQWLWSLPMGHTLCPHMIHLLWGNISVLFGSCTTSRLTPTIQVCPSVRFSTLPFIQPSIIYSWPTDQISDESQTWQWHCVLKECTSLQLSTLAKSEVCIIVVWHREYTGQQLILSTSKSE